jgi:Cof subfamily protein (haloacid dehalogenase superfamily)
MNSEWMAPQPGDTGAAVARQVIAQGHDAPHMSQARPRLAVFDIDGTLLDPAGKLRPQVRRAVTAARESGTRVMIATGRSPWDVVRTARDLGLSGPQLTMNGGVLSDPVTGEIVWARRLAADVVLDGIEFAREVGTRALANFIHRHVLESAPDGSLPADVADFVRTPRLHLVRSLEEVAGYGPVRFYIPTGHERHSRALAAAQERFAGRASIVWGDEHGIELLAPGTNKGSGVRTVAESMGLSCHEVMAVGDAANDLEMLAWAGHGVAMGDAPADVKAAARVVVPSSADDGVVEAVRRIFPALELGDELDPRFAEPAA